MTSNSTVTPETEFVLVPRTRTLLRILLDLMGLRTRCTTARERGNTIVEAARVLTAAGRGGQIVSREATGDEWSITLGTDNRQERA